VWGERMGPKWEESPRGGTHPPKEQAGLAEELAQRPVCLPAEWQRYSGWPRLNNLGIGGEVSREQERQ
jgi:hypothetical protein